MKRIGNGEYGIYRALELSDIFRRVTSHKEHTKDEITDYNKVMQESVGFKQNAMPGKYKAGMITEIEYVLEEHGRYRGDPAASKPQSVDDVMNILFEKRTPLEYDPQKSFRQLLTGYIEAFHPELV